MTKIVFLHLAVQCGMLLTALVAYSQVKATDFLIDPSKHYAYLEFDHVGTRERLGGDATSQGLWMRLVNNCRVPLIVATFDPGTGDPGVGLYDEVVPAVAKGPTLRLERGSTTKLRSSRSSPVKMPKGYSAPDTFSTTQVSPGETLLFSVPANHVSPTWSLEVRFYLGPPGALYGSGPYSVLSFDWVDIPEQFRAARKDSGPSIGARGDSQKSVDPPRQH